MHTVHPTLYCCCPYVLNSRRALYSWNHVRRCFVMLSPGVGERSVPAAAGIQHGSLTVDTLDRDGNIAIPVDLLHILPKLAKFLRGARSVLCTSPDGHRHSIIPVSRYAQHVSAGEFELGAASQALKEQAAVHRKAVEQSRQWMDSLQLDDPGIGQQQCVPGCLLIRPKTPRPYSCLCSPD